MPQKYPNAPLKGPDSSIARVYLRFATLAEWAKKMEKTENFCENLKRPTFASGALKAGSKFLAGLYGLGNFLSGLLALATIIKLAISVFGGL